MTTHETKELIRVRSQLMQEIRSFFNSAGFLEVETPSLAAQLIPEPSIQYFSTELTHAFAGNRMLYLIPSPEIHMKRLIAKYEASIYQICKCFRNSEQIGHLHNPEFTMLEWYAMGCTYTDSIDILRDLLRHIQPYDMDGACSQPIEVISMSEACMQYGSFDLEALQDTESLYQQAHTLGMSISGPLDAYTWEELFNLMFLTFVEPELPRAHPVVVKDYPKQIACLAKDIPGTPWKERWECYINGMEIANCFTEETDPVKVSSYFNHASGALSEQAQAAGTSVPGIDHTFPEIFHQSLVCSGTALGIDRLIMALTGEKDIQGVILFPLSDIL